MVLCQSPRRWSWGKVKDDASWVPTAWHSGKRHPPAALAVTDAIATRTGKKNLSTYNKGDEDEQLLTCGRIRSKRRPMSGSDAAEVE